VLTSESGCIGNSPKETQWVVSSGRIHLVRMILLRAFVKKGEKGVTPFYANLTLLRCHFSHDSRCFKSLPCQPTTPQPCAAAVDFRYADVHGQYSWRIVLVVSVSWRRGSPLHSGCTKKSGWLATKQIFAMKICTHNFVWIPRCQKLKMCTFRTSHLQMIVDGWSAAESEDFR
jgi:hypothetical protein